MALEQPRLFFFEDPKMLSDKDYLARIGFIPSPKGAYFGAVNKAAASANGYTSESGGTYNVAYNPNKFPGNPGGLPVGFAITPSYTDPTTGEKVQDQLGFTCAACHTGQITYKGTNIRIDGGPAVTDLEKLTKAIGVSLAYTKFIPGRFGRFADRVLGKGHSEADREKLESAFNAILKNQVAIGEAQAKAQGDDNVYEGFTRLDALNRIGNQVFFEDM